MEKIYGAYTEEIKTMVKDKLIEETRIALQGYDPADGDDPRALIAAIGGLYILADKICQELDLEKEQ